MAGFLTALGGIGTVLGGAGRTEQNLENQQQLNQNEAGFGKMIEGLGPDYDWAKQWFKQAGPGASHDIAAAMGGKIGDIFRQQAMSGQLAGIWNDPTTSPQEKLAKAAAIDPEYGKYFGEMAVQQAKQQQLGFKPSGKLSDFLNLQGLTPQAWDAMPKEEKQKMLPAFQDFEKRAGGTGDTELRQVYHPETGKTTWDYVPKSGPAGTSAGEVKPTAGGANVQEEINATQFGLGRLGKTIDDAGRGDDDGSMWQSVLQLRAHGALGTPDKQDVQILGQVSVLNTTLTGMVMRAWGSRNAIAAQEIINYHIPQAGDSPEIIKEKIDEWTRPYGYLYQYRMMTGSSGDESGLTGGGQMGGGGGGNAPDGGPSNDDYLRGAM